MPTKNDESPWKDLPAAGKRGCLVAIDGLDGTGLSTQASMLCAWMEKNGYAVHATKEPTSGPAGATIRQALQKRLVLDETSLALLFAADRADHLASEVVPLLLRGVNVVTDRYLLSSLAFQSAHVDAAWVEGVNAPFPPADLTVYLDVSPEECLRRIHASRWHTEKNEGLQELTRVRDRFHRSVERVTARGWRVEHVRGIDGADPAAVHAKVVAAVRALPLAKGPSGSASTRA